MCSVEYYFKAPKANTHESSYAPKEAIKSNGL